MSAVEQPDQVVAAAAPGERVPNRALVFVAEHWTVVAFLLVALIFFGLSADFLTKDNWIATSVYATGILALAVGQTFVIVSGGIDLSIGGTLSVSGMTAAVTMRSLGDHAASPTLILVAGVAAGVLTGLVVGVINGVAVSRLRLAPFIVTLGMMGVTQGAANLINDGQQISDIPNGLSNFGSDLIDGWLSWLVLVSLVIAVVGWLLLAKSRFGLHTYALGSNGEAARRAGIHVHRQTILVYSICGLCAGIAGVLVLSRFSVAQTNAGDGQELNAIAAVVIGGASLFGGKGSILGTVMGVGIMAMLVTGLVLIGLQPFWQTVVTGIVVVGAVYIDQLRDRLNARLGARAAA
jgi:ribose transport system permease protein